MTSQDVLVTVKTRYLKKESRIDKGRLVFSYTITITNNSPQTVQLLSRHWIITDGDTLKNQEVHGEGVVGQQPYISPGEHFTYTSGTVMESLVGTMHGSYDFKGANGELFRAEIPPFTLAAPLKVH